MQPSYHLFRRLIFVSWVRYIERHRFQGNLPGRYESIACHAAILLRRTPPWKESINLFLIFVLLLLHTPQFGYQISKILEST